MKALDLIRSTLQMTDGGVAALVADMRDHAMTQPVQHNGVSSGNHTLWLLGHMAFVEGSLRAILLGQKNPVEHWAPLFAPGSQPKADAAMYPSFDEVLRTLREVRAETLRMLDEVGEAGLDRRPHTVPPGFEEAMRTTGHTFMLIALHQMVHYGQIADARRAAGRQPLF